MGIDTLTLSRDEAHSRLHRLFDSAKAADEFEFACTLLRVRGMESAGWDPFEETHRLVEDLMTLVGGPLVMHTKARLGLLLYSHLTEVGTTYEVLENLARVVGGDRYAMDPFLRRTKKGDIIFVSTPSKVQTLTDTLDAAGHADVGEVIGWFFNSALRNAFAHADYSLHEDKFRAPSNLFEVGGVRASELPLETVAELVNRTLAFYDAFMTEYEEQRGGYRANKLIDGRFGSDGGRVPIELLADAEHGLYGFRAPPECPGGTTPDHQQCGHKPCA